MFFESLKKSLLTGTKDADECFKELMSYFKDHNKDNRAKLKLNCFSMKDESGELIHTAYYSIDCAMSFLSSIFFMEHEGKLVFTLLVLNKAISEKYIDANNMVLHCFRNAQEGAEKEERDMKAMLSARRNNQENTVDRVDEVCSRNDRLTEILVTFFDTYNIQQASLVPMNGMIMEALCNTLTVSELGWIITEIKIYDLNIYVESDADPWDIFFKEYYKKNNGIKLFVKALLKLWGDKAEHKVVCLVNKFHSINSAL